MKKISLSMLCALITVLSVSAQERHSGKKMNASTKIELMEYAEKNIYPVKKSAHDQFLAQLPKEDLDFLKSKRIEGKAIRMSMQQMKKSSKALLQDGKSKDEVRIIQKEKMQPLLDRRKEFLETLKPFMEKHKSAIASAMEQIEENKGQWETDKKAIIERNEGKSFSEGKEHLKRSNRKNHKASNDNMNIVKFILWDGTHNHQKMEQKRNKFNRDSRLSVSHYPNPSTREITFKIKSEEALTNANLIIVDINGRVILRKKLGKIEAGESNLQIELGNISPGKYRYILESDQELRSGSLIRA